MNYDPLRHQRLSRYPALAQYEDSFPSPQDAPSFQDTQVDLGAGAQRASWDGRAPWDDQARGAAPWEDQSQDAAPWGSQPRGAAPWDDQPRGAAAWGDQPRRTTGGLRAVPDLPRQATGGMPVLGEPEQTADWAAGRPPRGRRSGYSSGRGSGSGRGRLTGAVSGFLAAAVAIGMGNLAAAFIRPQSSPIIAVGEDFINHTPSALKNFAVEKFGENDKTMLLLGMYVTIALLAMVIGVLAWRRLSVGVIGIGLFGLFGAYVAITLPASHTSDVVPSVIAGITGIAAIVLLVRAGSWRSGFGSRRPAYRSGWSA